VRPATLITLILTCALIVLAITWVAPVVGVKNSACERLSGGGRESNPPAARCAVHRF
jgi:hypothetical protein